MFLPDQNLPATSKPALPEDKKGRLLLLADWVEQLPPGQFDMSLWLDHSLAHPCGTACCIGGTGELNLRQLGVLPRSVVPSSDASEKITTEWLQLTDTEALELLYPYWLVGDDALPTDIALYRHDARHAANVIRHFADTGKIDWDQPAP